MVEKGKNVVWTAIAKQQLKALYTYIKQDSPQNAEKFRDKIFASTRSLSKQPEKYHPDKYKYNNDGSFRAYEIYSCRISYYVGEDVVILRVVHNKRDQKRY